MISKRFKVSMIIVLILLLIQSIAFFSIKKEHEKAKNTIEQYHSSMINYSQLHINFALELLNNYIEDKQATLLHKVSSELKSASDFIQLYSIYYEYNNEGIRGANFTTHTFFSAFQSIADEWAYALEKGENDKIPSDEEIQVYIADIEKIAEAFEVFHISKENITRLSYEDLNDIIYGLVKKTRSEKVRLNFGDLIRD